MRIAFYPCCANDFEVPIKLLSNYADHIIFCDVDPKIRIPNTLKLQDKISVELITSSAKEAIPYLPVINVLFYRRDNPQGEGGSGLFVLGDVFLRPLMDNFCSGGGLLITDGSNSRGGNFKKMKRSSGLRKFNRHFFASSHQPMLSHYGLWCINVSGNQLLSERK